MLSTHRDKSSKIGEADNRSVMVSILENLIDSIESILTFEDINLLVTISFIKKEHLANT